jgi:dienelactone hydrolase
MKILTIGLMVLGFATAASAAGEAVSYEINGKTYEGHFVSPAPDAPFVLLFHDWDGLTDYEIRRAGMLAELGYAVFAADLFGAGVRPTAVEDKRRLTGELYRNRERMRTLLDGALKAAQARGADLENGAAMGYCFGGAAVLELARSGADLKGFVSFHGGLDIPEGQDYSRTRGEVLVFHGTADDHVTLEQFTTLAAALETEGVPHEMTTYGGAPHAFTVFGTERYRKEADRRSWERFTGFLKVLLR